MGKDVAADAPDQKAIFEQRYEEFRFAQRFPVAIATDYHVVNRRSVVRGGELLAQRFRPIDAPAVRRNG